MQKHDQIVKQICDFMGEDLEGEACKEVQEHLAQCPTCRVYFDTVKKTVTMYRQNEEESTMPGDVKDRLYKVLNLSALQNKQV